MSKIIKISPDNSKIAVIDTNNVLKLFGVSANSCSQFFHKENCWFVQWSQNSQYFCFANKDDFSEVFIQENLEENQAQNLKVLYKSNTQNNPQTKNKKILTKMKSHNEEVTKKKKLKAEVHSLVKSTRYLISYNIPSILMADLEALNSDDFLVEKQIVKMYSFIKRRIKDLLKDISQDVFYEKEQNKENTNTENKKVMNFKIVISKEKKNTLEREKSKLDEGETKEQPTKSSFEELCKLLKSENIRELTLFAGENLMLNLQLELAQRVFRIAKDYPYLKFIQKLIKIKKDPILQKAEVLLFLGKFYQLEDHLISNNRQDLLVSMLFRTKQWKVCLGHMNYLDVSQKEKVIRKCVHLYLKEDDRTSLRDLFPKLTDPELQVRVASEIRDVQLLSKLKSSLQIEHFQTQISKALKSIGISDDFQKVNDLQSSSIETKKNDISQEKMKPMVKCLIKILSSYIQDVPTEQALNPSQIKMVLVYVGLFKQKHSFSFSAKFKKNISRQLSLKLPGDPTSSFLGHQLVDACLEDPFSAAFPAFLFNSALLALKSKDLRKAFQFGALLKIHNRLIPKEQVLMLWSTILCGLDKFEECVLEMGQLKELASKKGDWEGVSKFTKVMREMRQLRLTRKGQSKYSLKGNLEFENVSPREICLSSGEVLHGKDALICPTCRFKTSQEEILKKKLAYCGLCRKSFN